MQRFVARLDQLDTYNPYEDTKTGLIEQIERITVESLITSFGLDFLITDQHGGDVDTIHNVRKIGIDPQMTYKNPSNESDYNNRGSYSHKDVEGPYIGDDGQKHQTNYQRMKREARNAYHNDPKNNTVTDAYTDKQLHFLGKSKKRPTNKSAELDHVKAGKEIHDDRGRVLAGAGTREMADAPTNLQWTNEHLNKSMGKKSIEKYIEEHPELPDADKKRMREADKKARDAYEQNLSNKYYGSKKFKNDLAAAAAKSGLKMGVKHALGFVFTEIWFGIKRELGKIDDDNLDKMLSAIIKGIKNGYKKAKSKYRDIINKFLQGGISGVLSNLITSLCNIFFTTTKNTVRIIRQVFPSIIEAGKIIFINPDNFTFNERMKTALKVLATGASLVAGLFVNEAIAVSGIGEIPVVGEIVSDFCGVFVTGILTCALIYFIDHSKLVNNILNMVDNLLLGEVTDYYREQAEYWEIYASKFTQIDLEVLKIDTKKIYKITDALSEGMDALQIHAILSREYSELEIPIPWEGDLNEFMKDKNNRLVFE